MKKRKWMLLLASICALVLFGICQIRYADKNDMRITVLSEKQWDKQKSRLKDAGGQKNMQFALFFEGEELPYNAADNTFFLPLDLSRQDYEAGAFSAMLLGSDAGVFFGEDFKKQAKRDLMRDNVKIPCLIVAKDAYAECSLTLTGTSLIRFTQTEFMTEDQMPLFELRVYDAKTKTDWVTTCYTTARLRGNTSLAYDKKSLRLKLKEKKEDGTFSKTGRNLLGLRKDDDWILNALYADDSKIKDKLAGELWNEAGGGSNPYGRLWGTQMEYVEAFLDDGYMGLYGLMYPIDKKQVGTQAVSVQLAKGAQVVERLYKKKYTAAWRKEDFIGPLPDVKMPDYRGGFYVKGDTVLADESEWEPLYRLASCIGADDETFAAQITQLVDQRNVIENWLFYNAIGGFDNYSKNYYYLVKDRNGEPYGYFIPWDLNLSFGDVYTDNAYYASFDMQVVHDKIAWEPADRMIGLDVAGSRHLLRDTWKKWREELFDTERVLGRMDAFYQYLADSGAYVRERAQFPEGRYAHNLDDMKRFETQRLAWLDDYIDKLTYDEALSR